MNRRRNAGPSQRQLRVGEEMRHQLVRIFARGHFRDPELADIQATVTEVRVSPDLRNATAYVTPFAGGDGTRLIAALNRAAGVFRGLLAKEMNLRLAPSVKFAADRSFDVAGRIEKILHDPQVARDLADDGEDGHGP